MPGFVIGDIGGNRDTGVDPSQRYYYKYTWEIIGLFIDNEGSISADNSVIVHAKDATLPGFNVSKETVMGSSLEYKFAKSVNWDDVKITWYDVDGLLEIVKRWRASVWTADDGIKPASSYKRDSILAQYFPDSDDIDERKEYKLYNSWPSVIRYGDLTYTTSDVKIVEVTLTYDWCDEPGDT